jgi:hypothetical protein
VSGNASKIASAALVLLVAHASSAARADDCDEFSELGMTLERNATDGDTEVVVFAKGGDVGLGQLEVIAPNGRRAAAITGDRRGIGLREFALESAEPPDLDRVLGSFPEGDYVFRGRTVEGDCLRGSAHLSHEIAPEPIPITPEEDEIVPIDELVLSWEPIADVERYVIELNDETAGTEYTLEVLPPTTSLVIPAALLESDSEYQFAVGAKMAGGNVTFAELTFFTAP